MNNMIRVLKIDVGQPPVIKEIQNDLDGLQERGWRSHSGDWS